MALVVRGRSVCHLCGRVMGNGERLVLFPPALFDGRSVPARLNDSAVHADCLANQEYGAMAASALAEYSAGFVSEIDWPSRDGLSGDSSGGIN